jgi:hypothetical protein
VTAFHAKCFAVACASGAVSADELSARWEATFGKKEGSKDTHANRSGESTVRIAVPPAVSCRDVALGAYRDLLGPGIAWAACPDDRELVWDYRTALVMALAALDAEWKVSK